MTNPPARTIGFIGLGRLGSVIASCLLDAGYPLVCCARGRSAELVARGATIPSDGSSRAVADHADVLFTCLSAGALESVFSGPDGVLSAEEPLPIIVELSTAPVSDKVRLREHVVAKGGELLDCPVSGTPEMAAEKRAVIYASGEQHALEAVADLLTIVSPGVAYVGELGAGIKTKYVANLLALVHTAAAAEAMAFAAALGLDLHDIAALLARSPAVTSGQFAVRAPMIAAGRFEGRLVTVQDCREVLEQIGVAAETAGAWVPLASEATRLFETVGDAGDDDRDPGVLTRFLANRANRPSTAPSTGPVPGAEATTGAGVEVAARSSQMLSKRLYVGFSELDSGSPPIPVDVVRDHLVWTQELEREGALFAAGPLVDDDGNHLGGGLFVIRAESAAEASAMLAQDPIHRGGFRRLRVSGWTLNEGRINVSVSLSDQTCSLP